VVYASFLLFEQNTFVARLANLSSDPRNVARIREIIDVINARIGANLDLKTFLGILLAVLSWIAMAIVQFATPNEVLAVLLPLTMLLLRNGRL
jgi:AI-2 transport protein TqsA